VVRNAVVALLALVAVLPCAAAQTGSPVTALSRAMDLEGKSQFREAAKEYRAALSSEDSYGMALLGLERSLHELGEADTLLVVVDSITRARPGDPTARTVQLRGLQMLGRSTQLRAAFESWRSAMPRDAAPYREYARILIDGGRMQSADSVLKDAEKAVVNSRVLSLELAQVRSALGFWDEAVDSWRRAVEDADYLERAAFIGLGRAPLEKREALRCRLLAAPAEPAVRAVLCAREVLGG
jgi:tetratricopeptide (TPR) repeat protein